MATLLCNGAMFMTFYCLHLLMKESGVCCNIVKETWGVRTKYEKAPFYME